ncbi:hypothetical protein K2173_012397 [Erythroxylum novogranatense]|uniref:RING-type domain-containing protein n=1 Tax=Erythroxylum novogranatense TaxID=1862640 RepID=A0AAV8UCN0_9ROSI|nr:hypothetical protein K2173_012397 [Erythroxylum novogranatense]
MNGDRQMEVHYINTGFPYSVTESFMDFFEGLTHMPGHYAHTGPLLDQELVQENGYWSLNLNAYKFGFSAPGSTANFGTYEASDIMPRMDIAGRTWEYPSPSIVNTEEPTTTETHSEGDTGIPSHPDSNNPQDQDPWQDDIDPDNMTYEELLDLGETVGTQSRGLSQELINMLPTSKCKFGSFFSRKRSGERCVICQMRYKRGEKQIKLPCKHVYHSECITKWLGINKVCPVCNNEVFGEESRN